MIQAQLEADEVPTECMAKGVHKFPLILYNQGDIEAIEQSDQNSSLKRFILSRARSVGYTESLELSEKFTPCQRIRSTKTQKLTHISNDEKIRTKKIKAYLISRTQLLSVFKQRGPDLPSTSRKVSLLEHELKLFDSDDGDDINTYNNQILKTLASDGTAQPQQQSDTNDENPEKPKSQNYFYKRAMLKDANIDRLKQLEYTFFQNFYGKLFDESKDLHIDPLLKLEALMLHNFEKLLRYNYQDVSALVKLVNVMEINISTYLLNRGSIMKFIFQDQYGNWLFFSTDKDNYVHPLKAEKGPWMIGDLMQSDQIYLCPDFFFPSNDYLISGELSAIFDTFEEISRSTASDGEFCNFDPSKTVMHLLMSQCEVKDPHYVETTTIKQLMKVNEEYDSLTVKIQRLAAVVLLNAGEAKEEDHKRQQRISFFRPGQDHQVGTKKKAKEIHMNMMKQQVSKDHEKIDENLHLPFPYVVEMMKGLQNILKLNSDRLIIKINQYLNLRYQRLIKMGSVELEDLKSFSLSQGSIKEASHESDH